MDIINLKIFCLLEFLLVIYLSWIIYTLKTEISYQRDRVQEWQKRGTEAFDQRDAYISAAEEKGICLFDEVNRKPRTLAEAVKIARANTNNRFCLKKKA